LLTRIPIKLTEKCQNTSYEILEDMRLLYNHRLVKGVDRVDRFLRLVNRRLLDDEGDVRIPKSVIPKGYSSLHEQFLIPEQELKSLQDKAQELLTVFEEARNRESLPPPLWLRLLPVCCAIIEESGLFPQDGSAAFRWVGFNVEVPSSEREENRITETVNINSYKTVPVLVPELLSDGKFCNVLSDILFDLSKAATPGIIPYTYWGIRFRSIKSDQPQGPWLDIELDLDNDKGLPSKKTGDYLSARRVTSPRPPFPKEDGQWIEELFRNWAFGRERNPSSQSLTSKSEQLRQYCRTLQHFYPNDDWPRRGIDTLLCPAVFWSLDRKHLGTAASIFWGFEGLLDFGQCNTLQLLSQILLSGIGQFARIADIQVESKEIGSKWVEEDFGHEIRGLVIFIREAMDYLKEKPLDQNKKVLDILMQVALDYVDLWGDPQTGSDASLDMLDIDEIIVRAKYLGFIRRFYTEVSISELLQDTSGLINLLENKISIKQLGNAPTSIPDLQPIKKAMLAGLSNAVCHILPKKKVLQQLLTEDDLYLALIVHNDIGIRIYNQGKYVPKIGGGTEVVMQNQLNKSGKALAKIENLNKPIPDEEQQFFDSCDLKMPIVRTRIQFENSRGD
jgi:hypothetical protein